MLYNRRRWETKHSDRKSINDVEKVLNWCSNNNIDVEFTNVRGACYFFDEQRIEINVNTGVKRQLYMLLHECGHFLIVRRRPSMLTHINCAYYENDWIVANRVAILVEEIIAWESGKRIAKRLRVNIDEGEYEKIRTQGINSYIKHTARKRVARRRSS